MGLAKATIEIEHTGDLLEVMFNPEEYTLNQDNNFASQNIPGLSGPILQFVHGNMRTLDMELFFDTTDQASDVRDETQKIVRLLEIDSDLHAPPVSITRPLFLRHTQMETVSTTEVNRQVIHARRRVIDTVGTRMSVQRQHSRKHQWRLDPLERPHVDRILLKTALASVTSPNAAPAVCGIAPALPATTLSTPTAMNRAGQTASTAPQINVQDLTDRVVQQIDRRFSAWRERTGRV